MFLKSLATRLATACALAALVVPAAARAQELTLWSHWAAEVAKRAFVEDAIKRFEAQQARRQGQDHLVREDRRSTRR